MQRFEAYLYVSTILLRFTTRIDRDPARSRERDFCPILLLGQLPRRNGIADDEEPYRPDEALDQNQLSITESPVRLCDDKTHTRAADFARVGGDSNGIWPSAESLRRCSKNAVKVGLGRFG